MTVKKKLRYIIYPSVLFIVTGCNTIFNPSETTDVVPYPPPNIKNVSVISNFVYIDVESGVKEKDFIGYNLYLSADKKIIDQIDSVDMNTLKNPGAKQGLYSIGEKPVSQFGGSIQSKTISAGPLGDRTIYYFAVTCYGSNNVYADINDHWGIIESISSTVHKVVPCKVLTFSLNNYYNTNYMCALSFTTNIFADSIVSAVTENNISNLIYFKVDQVSGGLTSLAVTGAKGSAGIQNIGNQGGFFQVTDLPVLGYHASGTGLKINTNQVYAVKFGSYYAKLEITNNIGTPGSTNDRILFMGRIVYPLIENESSF